MRLCAGSMLWVDKVDCFTRNDQASLEMSIIQAQPPSPGFMTVPVLSSEMKHMLIKPPRCPVLSVGTCNMSLLQNSSVTGICCYCKCNRRFLPLPGISGYTFLVQAMGLFRLFISLNEVQLYAHFH